MLHSPLMAANWEQMLPPLPPHIYSQNRFYCYISYHSPTTCKSLECLGFESQRWIVGYFAHARIFLITRSSFMGDIYFCFIRIFSLIFPTAFPATSLPYVIVPLHFLHPKFCLVIFIPNHAPISVSCSVHWKNCSPASSLAFQKVYCYVCYKIN